MQPDDVRNFATRDYRAVAREKLRHWARVFQTEGPEATLRASRILFAQARKLRPDWPTAADRAEDLQHHLRLRRMFERAAEHGIGKR